MESVTLNCLFFTIFTVNLACNVDATVPPGGRERLWRADDNLKDKAKFDGYLWKKDNVSLVQCSSECTTDPKCVSHLYNALSRRCIAHPSRLKNNTMLQHATGFNIYYSRPGSCVESYTYDYTADVCFKPYLTRREYLGAKNTCEGDGGHLIMVKDQSKQEFVDNLCNNIDWQSGNAIFIGATDIAQEGHFVWADGEAVSYQNWAETEPNNAKVAEDCVALIKTSTWTWFDYPCYGYPIPFICEITL